VVGSLIVVVVGVVVGSALGRDGKRRTFSSDCDKQLGGGREGKGAKVSFSSLLFFLLFCCWLPPVSLAHNITSGEGKGTLENMQRQLFKLLAYCVMNEGFCWRGIRNNIPLLRNCLFGPSTAGGL